LITEQMMKREGKLKGEWHGITGITYVVFTRCPKYGTGRYR